MMHNAMLWLIWSGVVLIDVVAVSVATNMIMAVREK